MYEDWCYRLWRNGVNRPIIAAALGGAKLVNDAGWNKIDVLCSRHCLETVLDQTSLPRAVTGKTSTITLSRTATSWSNIFTTTHT